MCGIAGWVDWTDDLTHKGPILERMSDTLCLRGPDAHGQWLSPHAALAHHRLIVIDPQTGGQPMLYQEGERTYAITYNGEIYNFRELRRELENIGHTFRTHSDTEVILHAYAEWGKACVRRLNGIFAFGLWDEQKQQLLLARDHLGVKPLFYARRGNSILFGSELKTLLAHPYVQPEIDAHGMAEILTFAIAPDSGVYRNVSALRPAHLAVCGEQGMHITDTGRCTAHHMLMMCKLPPIISDTAGRYRQAPVDRRCTRSNHAFRWTRFERPDRYGGTGISPGRETAEHLLDRLCE